MSANPFESVAPCRICLFGEHQDYLGLPVIALAGPLYCKIHVKPNPSSRVLTIQLPPQVLLGNKGNNNSINYNLDNLPDIDKEKPDFALAALKLALDDGWELPFGADCVSTTSMPLQRGISSSTAFVTAWIHVLATLAQRKTLSPLELAKRAHQAEVAFWNHPGGTMDHVTIALGGCLRIHDEWQVEPLPSLQEDTVWILADSGEPKDTLKHLYRCKTARLEILEVLGGCWDEDPATSERITLTKDQEDLRQTTLITRNTEREAFALWKNANKEEKSSERLGKLMSRHQEALRDGLGLSTPTLDRMNEYATRAGAWGFKLVGSGGGGCGVAWTNSSSCHRVEAALKEAGATQTFVLQTGAKGAYVKFE